jgi:hypothetical protein
MWCFWTHYEEPLSSGPVCEEEDEDVLCDMYTLIFFHCGAPIKRDTHNKFRESKMEIAGAYARALRKRENARGREGEEREGKREGDTKRRRHRESERGESKKCGLKS